MNTSTTTVVVKRQLAARTGCVRTTRSTNTHRYNNKNIHQETSIRGVHTYIQRNNEHTSTASKVPQCGGAGRTAYPTAPPTTISDKKTNTYLVHTHLINLGTWNKLATILCAKGRPNLGHSKARHHGVTAHLVFNRCTQQCSAIGNRYQFSSYVTTPPRTRRTQGFSFHLHTVNNIFRD